MKERQCNGQNKEKHKEQSESLFTVLTHIEYMNLDQNSFTECFSHPIVNIIKLCRINVVLCVYALPSVKEQNGCRDFVILL
jgi:hypothetical protein